MARDNAKSIQKNNNLLLRVLNCTQVIAYVLFSIFQFLIPKYRSQVTLWTWVILAYHFLILTFTIGKLTNLAKPVEVDASGRVVKPGWDLKKTPLVNNYVCDAFYLMCLTLIISPFWKKILYAEAIIPAYVIYYVIKKIAGFFSAAKSMKRRQQQQVLQSKKNKNNDMAYINGPIINSKTKYY